MASSGRDETTGASTNGTRAAPSPGRDAAPAATPDDGPLEAAIGTKASSNPEAAAKQPEARGEPVTPFVPWSADDRAQLSDELDGAMPLPIELLCDPPKIVRRLLDPDQVTSTVLGALAVIASASAFFGAVMAVVRGGDMMAVAQSAGLLAVSGVLALAAALGPIYAAGVLVAARLPMARLVATLVASAAAGAMILAALVPIPYGLFRVDPEWAGPLSVMGVFGLAALASGRRLYVLLFGLAETVVTHVRGDDAMLSDGERFRVGIVARMAMTFLAFTSALGMWAFDVFA